MRIIDFHTHIFPDALAAAALPRLEERVGVSAAYDGTAAGLLMAMDRADVEIAVVQPVATKPAQVRTINDWVATLASDRIVPFGAMHHALDDPAAEMARIAALGIRGIKLHPDHQDFEPHDRKMATVYQAAIDNDMIVLFHAGGDGALETGLGTPQAFAAMLDEWPGMNVVLAHMGGFKEWDGVERHLLGRDVWFDTAYTPGNMPDERFVRLVREHGADRILFGSDGPWTDLAREIERLRETGLTAKELQLVLCGNAERLLGIG